MTTHKLITDEQLARFADGLRIGATNLECHLANFIIDDRKAFRQLIKEIEPMAKRTFPQEVNVFARQLDLIHQRL